MLISFPLRATQGRLAGADVAWAAPLDHLRTYWQALRSEDQVPLRADVDPRGLEPVLGGAFLLERLAPGVARFRIAGMLLSSLAGCEARGLPPSLLFAAAGRAAFADALERVFDHPAQLDLTLEAERGIGRPALSARMLILPLRGDSGATDLALGGIALSVEPGRRARQFHISRTSHTDLPQTSATAYAEPVRGLAEDATPFAPAKPASRHGHLRLIRTTET